MIGFGDEGQPKSEFNMAVAWLNRLNYYFYICDEASHNLDAHEWLQTLMILYRELTTEIKDSDQTKWQTKSRQLFDRILQSNKNQIRTRQRGIDPQIYWDLHEFDQFLRKAMDKSGLLKKIQDDASRALK